MKDISIIGAGRLGTSLGLALSKKGYRIRALSCRTLSSAEESRQIIGEGIASTDNIETARHGQLTLICLPDEEISKVARALANSGIDWQKKWVFHCSGLLSSDELKPLKARGAWTASFHPLQSLAQKKTSPKQFETIYFGVEGCGQALTLAKKIIEQLGGYLLLLQTKDKVLYHTSCSIASNYLVVLLDMATSLLKQIGLEEKEAFHILLPLIKGTLHNVKKLNTREALSGPIIRGDQKSVQKHLEALRGFPSLHETYRQLARQALEIAKRDKKLIFSKIRVLKDLLEGK